MADAADKDPVRPAWDDIFSRFALATSLASTAQLAADPAAADAARRFGAVPAILEVIKKWETARMAGAFPPSLRSALRDNTREFHLQASTNGEWDLQEVHLSRFTRDGSQPAPTEFRFDSPRSDQSFQWTVRATGKGPVRAVRIELNGAPMVDLHERSLPPGGSLNNSVPNR